MFLKWELREPVKGTFLQSFLPLLLLCCGLLPSEVSKAVIGKSVDPSRLVVRIFVLYASGEGLKFLKYVHN